MALRGYLPYFDTFGSVQAITFRLADSLPQEKLHQLEIELENMKRLNPQETQNIQPYRRTTIEQWLDSGMGCCALRHPVIAKLVQDALLKFDNNRYQLIAWCITPNHLHVLAKPHIQLSKIVQILYRTPGDAA